MRKYITFFLYFVVDCIFGSLVILLLDYILNLITYWHLVVISWINLGIIYLLKWIEIMESWVHFVGFNSTQYHISWLVLLLSHLEFLGQLRASRFLDNTLFLLFDRIKKKCITNNWSTSIAWKTQFKFEIRFTLFALSSIIFDIVEKIRINWLDIFAEIAYSANMA